MLLPVIPFWSRSGGRRYYSFQIIAKWFKGKELATAMGVQVALARIGSQAGYAVAIPLARAFGISTPVLLGLVLLLGGMIAFFILQ